MDSEPKTQTAESIDELFLSEAVNDVAKRMFCIAKDHGFHDNDRDDDGNFVEWRLAQFVANLHGEVSELWECVRKGTLDEECDKHCGLTNAEEELADIMIRAMDTAVTLGIRIGDAIAKKAAYNKTRPHMHGKTC